jgi:hypothetical protein
MADSYLSFSRAIYFWSFFVKVVLPALEVPFKKIILPFSVLIFSLS